MADKKVNLMPHQLRSLQAALRGVKGRKILDAAVHRTGSDLSDDIEAVRFLLDDGTELTINGTVVVEHEGKLFSAHNHYQTEEKAVPSTGVDLIRENQEYMNWGYWRDRSSRKEWESILAVIHKCKDHQSDKR
jgi:hypothetical protein